MTPQERNAYAKEKIAEFLEDNAAMLEEAKEHLENYQGGERNDHIIVVQDDTLTLYMIVSDHDTVSPSAQPWHATRMREHAARWTAPRIRNGNGKQGKVMSYRMALKHFIKSLERSRETYPKNVWSLVEEANKKAAQED